MKSKKVVTPVLLFLMIILLIIAVYINFVFRPLSAKIEDISLQNDLIKVQRMEIEIAMLDEESILRDIEDNRALLKEDATLTLIDGSSLADDLYAKAGSSGVGLEFITITPPSFAEPTDTGETVLLYTEADLGFDASYDGAVTFIGSLEASSAGAYEIRKLDVTRDDGGSLQWILKLRLYYYGSPSSVPPAVVESRQEGAAGVLPAILPGGLL